MSASKILFVTSELFPSFGYPTAGGGVRGEQVFESLKNAGFPVELALLRDTVEGKHLPDWATRNLYRPAFLDGVIEQAAPDVVLSEGWEPLSHLKNRDDRIYVADCPGPLVLENRLRNVGDLRANTFHKVETLARVDAVLCPSRAMRAYLTSFLTLAGWAPADTDRILEVPIALPEPLPERAPRESGDLTVFVGGVSWAWHRTADWLADLADAFEEKDVGRLRVRMGEHPYHKDLGEAAFEPVEDRISKHPRIDRAGLTDWGTLVEELRRTPLAIEWSPKHLEREIASPLRLVTYLWAGVPIIVRPHLDLAKEVAEYNAGWVVDDWDALLALLETLKNDPEELRRRSEGARRLARERHAWPAAHEKALGWLENPSRRDREPSMLEHSANTFREQEEELIELRAVREAMGKEMEALSDNLRGCLEDAEAFRALRQKLPYKVWKKLTG